MAHKEQQDFCLKVREKFPDFFKNKKVLDIGSLDINGSNNFLFDNCNYLGIDVGEGRNVDFISVGHLFDGPSNYYDTIISTEVFEHDMYYEDTIKNIMRMLKPGGLFIFTCAATGRPEHGTRRCGEDCAPLLIQISEKWADYYKNLEENDIRNILGFNETFPDGYFELNNVYLEIPSDLYFYGIKGGEKYLTNNIKYEFDKNDFNEHIFVIDSWPDNESKENDLINLIKNLKIFNIEILLSGHYPIKPEIQKMVDYFLFDKKNNLLTSDEFEEYSVASGRWTNINDYVVENEMEFHHDFAIWETMKNSFHFCKNLGKKYIHFLEYDNNPNIFQYRQSFLENIGNCDAILYEYNDGSLKDNHLAIYCATFIFSIKTDIAIQVIDKVKTKKEYFLNRPNGWQLERVFLQHLKEVTNNILISNYIANNNELNTQAVWNRDGIDRNGAKLQIYLAGEYDLSDGINSEIYIHIISGFHIEQAKNDYLIEINYGNYNKFIKLEKGGFLLEKIGKYRKGDRVKAYLNGVEIFNEYLGLNFNEFYKQNKVTFKNKQLNHPPEKINLNFIDGAYIQIIDNYIIDRNFDITFRDKRTNANLYNSSIKSNWFSKSDLQYFIDWNIEIKSTNYYLNYNLNLKNKNILISFESKSLGDNIAWISYVEHFKHAHNCEIYCSTFFNDLFKHQYPNIQFVNPGETINDIYATYRLGLFYNGDNYDTKKHPSNPIKEPLMKIGSDILGLDFVELKPRLPMLKTTKYKRVCIAIHSTSQCKYWNNENGWQEVVDFLISNGYEVRLLSKEEDGYMGNKTPTGVVRQQSSTILEILKTIQESQLFIGLSSGLSWLAWASGTPTAIISGFTDDYLEPKNDIIRIINKNVCNGCWHTHKFDPGNWNWCPLHEGTEREFECTKEITSEMVISKIKNFI
jgi:autotransporter strand-loop-strand O-heptosyltransferase